MKNDDFYCATRHKKRLITPNLLKQYDDFVQIHTIRDQRQLFLTATWPKNLLINFINIFCFFFLRTNLDIPLVPFRHEEK